VYVFDYGARQASGSRSATRADHGIISQNGNAYEEGLSEAGVRSRPTARPFAANRKALRAFLAPETTRWQYTHGVPDQTIVSPDGQNLDNFYLARPGPMRYSSTCSATTRATWRCIRHSSNTSEPISHRSWRVGKNDPFFVPAGAEASTDNPKAVVRFFDTGHFALETHASEIAESIRDFLK